MRDQNDGVTTQFEWRSRTVTDASMLRRIDNAKNKEPVDVRHRFF
ncbi:hypothetical protein BVG79_01545 [Ketogulonicigenium robustum]|uniref:Uncharacterized protein n=1 Tax=Ketogulonicigenium robustum TaxID=92947 RepID=A0A1W6P0G3_9RHOB|nr:hypothetical protein BVG79_01545 [Ketogulonicigenium robustum]